MRNRTTLTALALLIGLGGLVAWILWNANPPGSKATSGNETATGVRSGVVANSSQSVPPTNRVPEPSNRPPVDHLPSNTPEGTGSKEPKNPPNQPPKNKAHYVPVSQPLLAWDLGRADYERISKDPNATEPERAEAAARLVLDFWSWPGRNVQRLGGFLFEQDKYPVLAGFAPRKGVQSPSTMVHLDGNETPLLCLEQWISIEKGASRIQLRIRVMASREWAQRYFLSGVVGGARSTWFSGKLGSEQGLVIGDVCEGNAKDSPQERGRIQFVRHNVAVSVELNRTQPEGEAQAINVVELAQMIDSEIRAQSHDASTWEDLTDFRPVIDEFYFEPNEVPKGKEDPRVEIVLATHHPAGRAVKLYSQSEEGGRVAVLPKLEAPKFARLNLKRYVEGRPYRAWLLVYDDSLLFSLAEASVLVKVAGE